MQLSRRNIQLLVILFTFPWIDSIASSSHLHEPVALALAFTTIYLLTKKVYKTKQVGWLQIRVESMLLMTYKAAMMTETGQRWTIFRILLPNFILIALLCDMLHRLVTWKTISELWLPLFILTSLTLKPRHIFYSSLGFVYLRSLFILLKDQASGSFIIPLTIISVLVSRYLYFLSEHRMDFSSLQLSVGFIGCDDFHFSYAGSLLAINTFAIDVLIFLYTSVLLAEETEQAVYPKLWMLCQEMILCTSVLSTYILRRHLMLWAIFAPKLVFETCFYLVRLVVFVFVDLFAS
jgi:hypothetical protein